LSVALGAVFLLAGFFSELALRDPILDPSPLFRLRDLGPII